MAFSCHMANKCVDIFVVLINISWYANKFVMKRLAGEDYLQFLSARIALSQVEIIFWLHFYCFIFIRFSLQTIPAHLQEKVKNAQVCYRLYFSTVSVIFCISLKRLLDQFFSICLFFTDPHIEKEQTELAEKRHHLACEAFGAGTLPQLQSATYNVLEVCIDTEEWMNVNTNIKDPHCLCISWTLFCVFLSWRQNLKTLQTRRWQNERNLSDVWSNLQAQIFSSHSDNVHHQVRPPPLSLSLSPSVSLENVFWALIFLKVSLVLKPFTVPSFNTRGQN